MQFKNLDEIKQMVEDKGGVASVQVETLRDAYGAGKMGKTVAQNISDALAGLGLKHWPGDFPNYSYEWVRLYVSGSQVAKIVDAVLECGDEEDELIRRVTKSDDALTISKIRELVCD